MKMSPWSRVNNELLRRRLGWQSVANYLGFDIQRVHNWKSRGIPSKQYRAIADFLGRSVDWVEGLDVSLPEPSSNRLKETNEDELTIPQYAAGGDMGHGLVLEEKQPGIIKSWKVDHEWLRLNVRHHTGVGNLCIVTGFGPSMQPKYNPGDPLLLDQGVTSVDSEGIYFFRVGKHGFIKQLQRIPTDDGMIIRAKSLNITYDPFDISAKMDFQVFGKVLTVWKSEQV